MGHTEKAMATLTRIAKDNGKNMLQGRIIAIKHVRLQIHGSEKANVCNIMNFLLIIINVPSNFVVFILQNERGRIKDLFTSQYRKTTLLLCFIWLVNIIYFVLSFNFS